MNTLMQLAKKEILKNLSHLPECDRAELMAPHLLGGDNRGAAEILEGMDFSSLSNMMENVAAAIKERYPNGIAKPSKTSVTLDIDLEDLGFVGECDEYGECGDCQANVGDALMEQMLSRVESKAAYGLKERLVERSEKILSEKLDSMAQNIAMNAMIEAASKKVEVENDESQKVEVTLIEHKLLGAFNTMLNEKTLDENGRVSDNWRDKKYTTLEYLAAKKYDEITKQRIKLLMDETIERTKAVCADQISKNFASVMTNFLVENQGAISMAGFTGNGITKDGE